jgi:hypothetical protein
MFDNGKVKVSILDNIPLIEVYHDGELELADVEWVNHIVLNELVLALKPPVDIIVDRKGNYSLSVEALAHMENLMKDANRVAYVVYSPTQEQVVQMASNLYLSGKTVANFHSVVEASAWLKNNYALALH